MTAIDPTTERGAALTKRLHDEPHLWITTVSRDGTPFPKPVWFWWDGDAVNIYSEPTALAVKHLARSPRVSMNLNTAGGAAGMMAIIGTASCTEIAGGFHEAGFLAKYAGSIPALLKQYGLDFGSSYTTLIRVIPDRVIAH